MYQLNNVPNNIIELSHSKLSDNAVLSIARRIAMFKNNDALEPTHHICSLIAEASVRLTAVTDVTTAVSSIRIQLTLGKSAPLHFAKDISQRSAEKHQ